MSLLKNFHKNNVRQWILLRMAASEFYFKQPYDIDEEYPIMTSIMGFALFPIFMIFVFLYACAINPLVNFVIPGIIILFVLSFGISFLMICAIKNAPFITETIREYESMDLKTRKEYYTFKYGFKVAFTMVVLPWIIFGIAIAIICLFVPHP